MRSGAFDSGAYGVVNDLWMYNRTTTEWSRMSGLSNSSDAGTFTTVGAPASASFKPTARFMSTGAVDASQQVLYLFGGSNAAGTVWFADLW